MGRPRMEDARCKRHPKHQQSKGVCPFCLRERLSGLLAGSSSGAYSSSSSVSSSPYSSDSDLSSSAITPPYLHDLKRARLFLLFKARTTHGGRLVGISEPLTKSLSLASALLGNRRKEDKKDHKEKGTDKKKERRSWPKLLGGLWRSSKAGGVSLHSRTVKEKSALFV
ncbi:putative ataxin-2 [Cocos nucifera]|uniref:Putative ataxin-2 n=1 Tax=Cocos nucifera TaxID=13894 RepID=A0A8K0IUC2_COCNU|nr:putative ataxin-2 [Cocos nucifera]